MRNEVIMVRSQRNFYDHAVRAAGATIIEVGLPDRYAGAGVREAEVWEIEDAITEKTAAIFYVADAAAQPPLKDISRLARRRKIPVIVDAAAQLPPQSNLRRFIREGADLVAFSGGKALGGPQASGMLCGKRDLVMAAALQHLDLDVYWDMWTPPPSLIDKRRLKGAPQHGIGRSCKAGKEEIVGLLTALKLFIAEGDKARHARWLALLRAIESGLGRTKDVVLSVSGAEDTGAVPNLYLSFRKDGRAAEVAMLLQRQSPAIHVDAFLRERNILTVNPMCLTEAQIGSLVRGLRKAVLT
jgi:L-seryl-tRNA(Ser) seleniumtransferase